MTKHSLIVTFIKSLVLSLTLLSTKQADKDIIY